MPPPQCCKCLAVTSPLYLLDDCTPSLYSSRMYHCGPCSVGIRVRIYWPTTSSWAIVKIHSFAPTNTHVVEFEDGFKEMLTLKPHDHHFAAETFAQECKTAVQTATADGIATTRAPTGASTSTTTTTTAATTAQSLTDAALGSYARSSLLDAESKITATLADYTHALNYDPVNIEGRPVLSQMELHLQLLNKFEDDRRHAEAHLNRDELLRQALAGRGEGRGGVRGGSRAASPALAPTTIPANAPTNAPANANAKIGKKKSGERYVEEPRSKKYKGGKTGISYDANPNGGPSPSPTNNQGTPHKSSHLPNAAPPNAQPTRLLKTQEAAIWARVNSSGHGVENSVRIDFASIARDVLGSPRHGPDLKDHFERTMVMTTLVVDDKFHQNMLKSSKVAPYLGLDSTNTGQYEASIAKIEGVLMFIACKSVEMRITDDGQFRDFDLSEVKKEDIPRQCKRCQFYAPSTQTGSYICSKTLWCEACVKIPSYFSGALLKEILERRPDSSEDAKAYVDQIYGRMTT